MPYANTYTEPELVTRLQEQDPAAFNYLYEKYSGALYSIILQVIPENETASDLLQEVFVSIWKKIGMYDSSKGRLFTWMLNVSRNAAIDKLRSKSYKNSLQNREFDSSVHINTGTTATALNTDAIGLRKMVNELKKEYKEVLELSYFQGFTHEEVSKQLGIPLGTVKTRIRSALTFLRQNMK
ncbi:MAG: sigma-70 family RNA polymerase sigma factor [Dinghuibacter sp.]|nr:sigma-70 family RNA polymerase sigma factor [Dinghuibacter sp.]